ncbi:hypothetical protein [Sphingobacterium hotanense]|uniref:hypothetical protein n=1 Tax=Sphingobacterium hotanense TaxID=649196 RepID=UPI0011F200BC|nr:hypothetical protein [Sphingobacterium hotanense]
MSLGDLFPKNFKEDHFKRIDLGAAILVEIPNFNINHKKFAIYFANDNIIEGNCGLVIINSEINENVNRNKFLRSQHIPIDVERHQFLEYDSFIDCTQIHNKVIQEIVDFLVRDPKRLLGNVAPDVLLKVHDKLVNSRLISKKEKLRYSLI